MPPYPALLLARNRVVMSGSKWTVHLMECIVSRSGNCTALEIAKTKGQTLGIKYQVCKNHQRLDVFQRGLAGPRRLVQDIPCCLSAQECGLLRLCCRLEPEE